ncbi:Crp/Fnr family transcriptional regulator [Maricaulis sp.]|uniref:Crp/Fnr family transcriptional regulator n=1 Tax=unclassified Maricaulis TaxID=2632371 RepID=UPI001B22A765|nr:Crp/Fnr family transcriptional regulator [Maricaulis sp.]MBO6797677.1 Crp/Fnr family transcriptional regulator [Maricaulis sp.]
MSFESAWESVWNRIGLTDAVARAALQRASELAQVPDGEPVISQDATDDSVYLLLDGEMRVGVLARSGQDVWVSYLEPGAMFGEMAALTGDPRTTEITASKDSVVARITGEDFLALIEAHGQIGLALSRMLAARMHATTRRMFELSALSTTGRIYAELLRMSRSSDEGGTRIISPIPSFKEIGDRVAAARETVSRTVSRLAERGLIQRGDDHIELIDPEQLSRLEDTM